MLFSLKDFFDLEKKVFKYYQIIIGKAAILFNGQEPLNKLSISLPKKAPCEIWWKLVKQFQRRKCLKITHLYMYKAQGQGLITPRGKNLIVIEKIYYFNQTW